MYFGLELVEKIIYLNEHVSVQFLASSVDGHLSTLRFVGQGFISLLRFQLLAQNRQAPGWFFVRNDQIVKKDP